MKEKFLTHEHVFFEEFEDVVDDFFLEIVEGTDVLGLLALMPECQTIVTTGGKASEELQAYFHKMGIEVEIPKVGRV